LTKAFKQYIKNAKKYDAIFKEFFENKEQSVIQNRVEYGQK